jgi:DNA-binding CsgD family transcriptional regulator
MRLHRNDVAEFAAMKALCYRGLGSAELRERIGDRLARHLSASSYCFGATDPASALPVHSVTQGLLPETMQRFYHLVLGTPGLDFARWLRGRERVARLEQLVDDVDADPYMIEVLRPAGLRYDVQVACIAKGQSWGHLCVRRRAEAGPFSASDLRLLSALAPHLTAGLRAAAARASLAAVPADRAGVVVIGPDGIELANGVAERLLVHPRGRSRHSFVTAVHVVAAQLAETLGDAGSTIVPELEITDEDHHQTYRLRGERVDGADGRARGLIVIEPGSTGARTTPAALVRLGLTEREADVALAVLRDRTTAEIAVELGISPHTVHDHLRNVFAKLDVGSRQQLAMRLLAG